MSGAYRVRVLAARVRIAAERLVRYYVCMNAPANIRSGTKLIKVGNSVGVIIPRDVLAKLGLEVGDALSISDAPGGVTLSRYDPEFERQMTLARQIMKERRNALRELAK